MINNNIFELLDLYVSNRMLFANNELTFNDSESASKLIASSILSELILSKKIFRKNIYIGDFLKNSFNLELSKSMLHSRTMICGKITRYIFELEDKNELEDILNTLYITLKKIKLEEDIFSKDIYDVIKGIKL